MDDLVEQARDALASAYAPYSEYQVGAAIQAADGSVFTGCNIENANYSNSLHAEEVALSAAVAAGHRSFALIAVTSSEDDGVLPCGMCRQTLNEFCDPDFGVITVENGTTTEHRLGDLLPNAISPETLGR